ncbi:MAG: hypothetical protein RL478_553 [Actinomycetota bacterium]|jgi:SAM-dependent methyltransferase
MEITSRFSPPRVLRALRRRFLSAFLPPPKGRAREIHAIPLEFEAWVYRTIYPEIASLSDNELWDHYQTEGKEQGRRCHQVHDRLAFVRLIPKAVQTLEIGPYARPLVTGPRVKYVDMYTTDELRERAPAVGMNPEEVPDITWVAQPSDLSCVDEHFGVVLSSHAIEHQPDLVNHLNQVDQILEEGGQYFVLVPDHRYCFDHFMTPSTITDVLAAHLDKRASHTAESLLESRLLMTHNDPIEHWKGNHGDPAHNPEFPNSDRIDRLNIAMNIYLTSNGVIKDEHAWYFTPDTFQSIIQDLYDLGLIKLRIERMYPSMLNSGEFWTILRNENI